MSEDYHQIRKEKLKKWREAGISPYGARFLPLNSLREIKDNFPAWEGKEARVAGRIMSIREHGKSAFMDIQQESIRLQIYLRKDIVGEDNFARLGWLDLGDVIGAEGEIFKTRSGEVTLMVKSFSLLSKCLHPLPQKWYGLKDVEKRYRQRYLDFLVNPEVRNIFLTRSKIISLLRRYLEEKGFTEVETPMMHILPGGALAEPFVTHHNALDIDLYLRIAPELYLKRLIVGGWEKIYEINRSFRNEGVSPRHNPEFTMLELYWAYADYQDLMQFTQEALSKIIYEVCKSYVIEYQGESLDVSPPWERISFTHAFKEIANLDWRDEKEVGKKASEWGIGGDTPGKNLDAIFKKKILPHIIQPTFIYDYPRILSPLAKGKEEDLTERFQPIICGLELGNAYSELNDPREQRERFIHQRKEKESGDREAHPMDEDFVQALEYGMPPVAGLGIGIDRLVMLATNSSSIREVILFPLLRPE